jgi:hypothetical protein
MREKKGYLITGWLRKTKTNKKKHFLAHYSGRGFRGGRLKDHREAFCDSYTSHLLTCCVVLTPTEPSHN